MPPPARHETLESLLASEALVPGSNAEACRAEIREAFLSPKWALDAEWLGDVQTQWQTPRDYERMLSIDPAPSTTSLQFIRSGLQGTVVGYRETTAYASMQALGDEGKYSMSLQRPLSATQSFVRGQSGSTPFQPGGLDEDTVSTREDPLDQVEHEQGEADAEPEVVRRGQLRRVPPGFTRGLRLGDEQDTFTPEDAGVQALSSDLAAAGSSAPLDHTFITAVGDELYKLPDAAPAPTRQDAVVDELLPVESIPRVFQGVEPTAPEEKREWAHVVDASKQMPNFNELVPYMAHKYPFELDTFQKQAIYHLEQNDSVFVAAHTSAGKTVVAEYAIALASKHMSRCIYTSPIKALSNQKFREFKHTFGAENVGILTGDVQINPEAPCLIMTTEILRSMLYRGADLIRDVEFVVFDEVHYVNDQERGVVWEEVIILLPAHVNIVLLSATVPNTREFADWVGRTKKKDVYVISTTHRPVPLEHFLYAGKELHRVVDASGQFQTSGIRSASEALMRRQEKEREQAGGGRGGPPARGGRGAPPGRGRGAPPARGRGGGGGRGGAPRGGAFAMDKSLWVHLIGLLRKRQLLPVVVFVFSKRRCEEYASSVPNTDLCSAKEKSEVHVVIERSLMRLREVDQSLPQIQRMRELLSRGIGVHHGGLLPIVKELVEILFQRGLVKVLFATETFAMGVNMPARSVVFSETRKNDGQQFRNLLPGEYTQMSGRAGRRGLDATGVVIVVANDQPDTQLLNRMMLGQSSKLRSQFRITYSMVLNLLRVEAIKVEEMIKRSFSENATQRLLPNQQKQLKALQQKRDSLVPASDACRLPQDALESLYDAAHAATRLNHTLLTLAYHHSQGVKNLAPGRVVILRDEHFEFAVAFIVRLVPGGRFIVLAGVSEEERRARSVARDAVTPMWPTAAHARAMSVANLVPDVREVPLTSIVFVTRYAEAIPSASILSQRVPATRRALGMLQPVKEAIQAQLLANEEHAPTALVELEVDWARLRRLDFYEARDERNNALVAFEAHQKLVEQPEFAREYQQMHRRKLVDHEIVRVSARLSNANLELLPEYHQRIEVLKELRFIDPESETVLLKGRVACELKSVNELILTELILDNTFIDYEPEETAALLSVFLFRDKTAVEPALSERLSHGYQTVLDAADRVAAVQTAHQLNSEDDALTLKPGLMEVVYQWAKGMHFHDIMQLTDVGEGTIVRIITRLDETFREMRDASRVIGDTDLYKKMERCQQLIRRDIVFAASLYF